MDKFYLWGWLPFTPEKEFNWEKYEHANPEDELDAQLLHMEMYPTYEEQINRYLIALWFIIVGIVVAEHALERLDFGNAFIATAIATPLWGMIGLIILLPIFTLISALLARYVQHKLHATKSNHPA